MRRLIPFLISASAAIAGGLRYGVPDYAAMFRDSDLVAIVRFHDLKDTGLKKELDDVYSRPSGLHFRELKGTARVISLIRGAGDEKVAVRLYRYPTIEESSNDLGDRELARKRLAACFRNSGLVHVFPGIPRETELFERMDFLVYLKKTGDGFYAPATGDSDSYSSIRQLNDPSVAAKLTRQAQSGPRE